MKIWRGIKIFSRRWYMLANSCSAVWHKCFNIHIDERHAIKFDIVNCEIQWLLTCLGVTWQGIARKRKKCKSIKSDGVINISLHMHKLHILKFYDSRVNQDTNITHYHVLRPHCTSFHSVKSFFSIHFCSWQTEKILEDSEGVCAQIDMQNLNTILKTP